MQKFSFLSKVVKYQRGQEVEIHTSHPLTIEATVQIRSNFKELDNKIYVIQANNTLIFKHIPKSDGFVEAIRVWNVVWEDDGIYDFKFEGVKPIVVEAVEETIAVLDYADALKNVKPVYKYTGWANVEIFKTVEEENQLFEFWLSEANNTTYVVESSDSDFVIKNPEQNFTINRNLYLEITLADIIELIVCMKVSIGVIEYPLQGCNTLEDLEKELLFHFESDPKIQIYSDEHKIIIVSQYYNVLKFKLFGANNKTINKFFSEKSLNKNIVIIQCVNSNWKKKTVEFSILSNGLTKRPVMKVHFKTINNDNYLFEIEKSLVIGEPNFLYLTTSEKENHLLQISSNVICENLFGIEEYENGLPYYYWNINVQYGDEAIFKIGDKCEQIFKVVKKIENVNLLYNVTVSAEEVVLKIYLSHVYETDYTYSIMFNDKISKQNADFKLVSNYQTINAGQLEKKERIVWNNNNIIRSFDVVLNDIVIPIIYLDKNAYCSSIGLKSKDLHYLNKAVNRDLILECFDGAKIEKIYLKANQNNWTYVASSKSVNWKVYDQDVLIFEQYLSYDIDQKPSLKIYVDEIINSKGVSYLTLKTDWPVKTFIDFELSTISNTIINLTGKYRLSPEQTEIKFKLTPLKLRTTPAYLSIQILSASIEYDNKRYTVMIN
jgi:hypothetical protein